ncbi:MAG: hypothetical protein U0934_05265 [Pseudotabrizicola sp.]|uniref:hypothetical protein n=1 Tax=Pseudotabrizicola sp. TaxID=2939647 RepID=UPI00272CF369|nr:hypothetical protein [Pseudotabrizicola sp.]MDP2080619.1 hypothetical protein [Pseudotabrizicola sp.]MDZ7573348.1 hypothetical protein [Pseudotabrizicola sp.]
MILRFMGAAVFISLVSAGGAMATNLTCTLLAGDPSASQRLCDAVQARLDSSASGQFDLQVLQSSQTFLQARLSHTVAKKRVDGPEMTVSIMDRDSFPDQVLTQFAASLVSSISAAP